VLGCTSGLRGEVPGERRSVIRDDDNDNNNTHTMSAEQLLYAIKCGALFGTYFLVKI